MESLCNLKVTSKIVLFTIIQVAFLFLLGLIGYYFGKYLAGDLISTILIILILLMSILIVFAGLFLAHLVVEPIKSIRIKLQEITKGNFECSDLNIPSNDEVGQLADSVNRMKYSFADTLKREKFLREILFSSISTLDIKHMLSSIVTKTGKSFNASRCYIAQYNSETGKYKSIEDYEVYIASPEIKSIAGLKLDSNVFKSFAHILFIQKQGLKIEDIETADIPEPVKAIFNEYGIKSILAAPIFYSDFYIGVLIVDYCGPKKQFNTNEVELVTTVACYIGAIIRNTQLFQDINEMGKRERTLRNIINDILMSPNLEAAVNDIVTQIGKLFNIDRVAIRFYDPLIRSFSQPVQEYRKNENIPSVMKKVFLPREVEERLSCKLFDNKQTLVIEDIEDAYADWGGEILREYNIKSIIATPIFYKEQPLAAIFLTNTESRMKLKQEDMDLLNLITQEVSIGINLFNTIEQLSKSLLSERIIRELIVKARTFEDHNSVYDYLLEKLTGLFNTDGAYHLHYDENTNLTVVNEAIKGEALETLLNQTILSAKDTQELSPAEFEDIIVINDINNEIQNQLLRNYLDNKKIRAFLLYPKVKEFLKGSEGISSSTMVCSLNSRKWTSNEVELFKLVIDASSITYLEVKQRKTEELRRLFLAALTHDLRSPLYAEQKAIEMMLSKNPDSPIKSFYSYLQEMYQTNEELLRIVNNILIISHYEHGQLELHKAVNNTKNIIEDAVKSVRTLANEKDLEIIFQVQEGLPLIIADKDEIVRVLINLLSNAIKHTKKGTNIDILAKQVNEKVQISIQDKGEGILEEDKAKIFEMYPTGKRKIGTGLGLYLSKQIIEAHNERIWFESESGKGTTFYFTLSPVSNGIKY